MTTGIIATIKIQPGKNAEFEAAFGELQAATKANEPGCLQYDLFKSQAEPETYYVFEQYADADAVAAHRGAPHAKVPGAKVGATLAGRPAVQLADKIS